MLENADFLTCEEIEDEYWLEMKNTPDVSANPSLPASDTEYGGPSDLSVDP